MKDPKDKETIERLIKNAEKSYAAMTTPALVDRVAAFAATSPDSQKMIQKEEAKNLAELEPRNANDPRHQAMAHLKAMRHVESEILYTLIKRLDNKIDGNERQYYAELRAKLGVEFEQLPEYKQARTALQNWRNAYVKTKSIAEADMLEKNSPLVQEDDKARQKLWSALDEFLDKKKIVTSAEDRRKLVLVIVDELGVDDLQKHRQKLLQDRPQTENQKEPSLASKSLSRMLTGIDLAWVETAYAMHSPEKGKANWPPAPPKTGRTPHGTC